MCGGSRPCSPPNCVAALDREKEGGVSKDRVHRVPPERVPPTTRCARLCTALTVAWRSYCLSSELKCSGGTFISLCSVFVWQLTLLHVFFEPVWPA